MVHVCCAWIRVTGVRVTSTGLRTLPTWRAVLRAITPVIERHDGRLTMRSSGRGRDWRTSADGAGRAVAGEWFGLGAWSPGTGVAVPEGGWGDAAQRSRTKRAPGALVRFAGAWHAPAERMAAQPPAWLLFAPLRQGPSQRRSPFRPPSGGVVARGVSSPLRGRHVPRGPAALFATPAQAQTPPACDALWCATLTVGQSGVTTVCLTNKFN